jgi:hypothetical protein
MSGVCTLRIEIDHQVEALTQREGWTSRKILPACSMSLRAAGTLMDFLEARGDTITVPENSGEFWRNSCSGPRRGCHSPGPA